MRILLTGASGYVGKRLIERCLAEGYDVVVLGRSKIEKRHGVTFVSADITNREQLLLAKKVVGKVSLLIHMAAKVPKTPLEDVAEEMIRVNATGTLNVLEVFGESLKKVVYASTAEVYGLPDTTGRPITEDQLPVPMSNYGASKLAGEYLCRVFCEPRGITYTLLRFSVMYGQPDTIARAIPNFISKARANLPLELYGGEELRDYLHVDDATEAIICAAKAKNGGVYNIGSGAATSIREAAEAIIKAAKSSSELRILPRQKKASNLIFDSTAAQNNLGYQPNYIFPAGIETQLQ